MSLVVCILDHADVSRLWAQSQMLDVVQTSFESKEVDTLHVLRVAATSIFLTTGDDVYNFFASHNDALVRTHINFIMERAYMRAQLCLSIPAVSNPHISALMYEAGCFAGFEARRSRNGLNMRGGGPFEAISSIFSLLTLTIQVATQLYLLLRTLTSAAGNQLNGSSIALIALSLLPSVLRLGGSFFFAQMRNDRRRLRGNKDRSEERELRQISHTGEYKQEVVLFGLADWVLDKWTALKQRQLKEQEQARENMGMVRLGLGMSQQAVETAFYVSQISPVNDRC